LQDPSCFAPWVPSAAPSLRQADPAPESAFLAVAVKCVPRLASILFGIRPELTLWSRYQFRSRRSGAPGREARTSDLGLKLSKRPKTFQTQGEDAQRAFWPKTSALYPLGKGFAYPKAKKTCPLELRKGKPQPSVSSTPHRHKGRTQSAGHSRSEKNKSG
jgi:hypothetical protein